MKAPAIVALLLCCVALCVYAQGLIGFDAQGRIFPVLLSPGLSISPPGTTGQRTLVLTLPASTRTLYGAGLTTVQTGDTTLVKLDTAFVLFRGTVPTGGNGSSCDWEATGVFAPDAQNRTTWMCVPEDVDSTTGKAIFRWRPFQWPPVTAP